MARTEVIVLSLFLAAGAWWGHRQPAMVSQPQVVMSAGIVDKPGLVGWWAGNGNALDALGVNDAILVHHLTYADGLTGKAFSFDGVDGYVNLPDSESLKLTKSLTVEASVNPESSRGGWNMIVFRGDSRPALDPYFLALQMGSVHFHVESLSQAAEVVVSAIPLHEWTHVAGTLDDATGMMRLYINGRMATETHTNVRPFKDLDASSPGGITIGNHAGRPASMYNFPFHGRIGEVKLYSRALSAAEVRADASESDGKTPSTMVSPSKNL